MPKKLSTEKNVSSTKSARRTRVSEDEVTASPKDLNPLSQRALQTIENNYRQILEMQDRILSAPAMNGGFTTLLFKVENIESHKMHSEYYEVSQESVDKIVKTKAKGGRIIAVGTTAVRTLESIALNGDLSSQKGETDIFIYPGFEFRIVDVLITNFHLPKSAD